MDRLGSMDLKPALFALSRHNHLITFRFSDKAVSV